MTTDAADRLERWAALAREVADEVVLLVDAASDDATLAVARRVADRVAVVEHPPYVEVAMDFGLRAATGEWALWLDDDELLHPAFGDRLDVLLADPDVTHYHQPYRWVLPDGAGGYDWIASFPWHPNPRLRLVRRTGAAFAHRGRLHSPFDVAGDGVVLDDERDAIFHLDFVLRDREARERKIGRYRGHPAPSCEEYYRWEDYEATLVRRPLDARLIDRRPTTPPARRAPAAWVDGSDGRPVPVAELRRRNQVHWPNADVFAAAYPTHTTPGEVLANRGYTVEVGLVNTSRLPWPTSGPDDRRVTLGYRWSHAEHGTLLREGDVTLLPGRWPPGASATVPAGLWSPYDPGTYRLEWDLRRGSRWFSTRGVAPLAVDVVVAGGPRLLATPRTVARLPARAAGSPATAQAARPAPAPSAPPPPAGAGGGTGLPPAANLVAIPTLRLMDTRDGSGVPGAPAGPVAAGDVVVVDALLHPGIPDTAVGLVGQLSVPAADYNGFVAAYPAGAADCEGTVSVYFRDDGPTTNLVVIALGTGPHAGQLALRVSDNHPGTVELILDVVAYLD